MSRIATIAIGANAAIISVVNGVLLKPLPFDEPTDLVAMWHEAPGLGFDLLNQSPATYLTYRAGTRVVEDVAMWDGNAAQGDRSLDRERNSSTHFPSTRAEFGCLRSALIRERSRVDTTAQNVRFCPAPGYRGPRPDSVPGG